LTYSPYTLGGHLFTGGALELTPNGFFIGGMYGRFRKAVAADPVSSGAEQVSYKRMGYAFKAGYEREGNALTLSYFYAKDDPNSLLFVAPDAALAPMENAAVGISGKATLWTKVTVEGEFAASGLTRNIFSEDETTDFAGWEKWLVKTKTTTAFYKAWKGAVAYTAKSFSVALKHEHVDPGYQTLGAYFFNNDLENWTIAPAFRFLEGKLSLSLNTGFQKNNLAGDRLSTTQRWVGSANVAYTPSKRWMMNAAYSNFTSYTRNRPNADPFWTPSPADTLSFYQLAQQGNAMVSYTFGKKITKQSIALLGAYQVTGQQQSGDVLPSSTILNGNLTWNIQWMKTKWSVTVLANYNQSENGALLTQQFGPGVQLGKSFMKNRLRFSGGGVYNRSMSNDVLLNHVLSYRAMLAFAPKVRNEKLGRPTLSANAVYISRLPVVEGLEATGELTVLVNVNYSF
jgi:hypothetical protein